MPPAPAAKAILRKLGYYNADSLRNRVKTGYDDDFVALTGDLDSYIDIHLFVDSCEQMFGMRKKLSRAIFFAMDLKGTGNMYRHDYLLFRVIFLDLMRDTVLLKYRYRAVFYFYNFDEDGEWSAADMRSFVRHICRQEHHVSAITTNIFSKRCHLGIDDFLHLLGSSEFGHILHVNDLSRSAIIKLVLEDNEEDGGEGKDEDPCTDWAGKREPNPLSATVKHIRLTDREHDVDILPAKAQPVKESMNFAIPPSAEFNTSYGRVVIDQRAVKAITRDHSSPSLTKVMSELLPVGGMNLDFEYDECFEEQGDWRGVNAAPRGSDIYELAYNILSVMVKITGEIVTLEHNEDISDFDWKLNGEILRRMLTTRDQSVASAADMVRKIKLLSCECRDVVRDECSLVDVPSPCKVYGDIHGQLRDLLLLFLEYGKPTDKGGDIETTSYVFNGDWVDRGAHQLEVVLILFALKVMYPARIFLVRGNHEFKYDCAAPNDLPTAIGKLFHSTAHRGDVCDALYEAFSFLPVAALVNHKILVLHGGLGDGTFTLDSLRHNVPRPLMSVFSPSVPFFLRQVLWSDPTCSDGTEWNGCHGNGQRGSDIHKFGPDITKRFCAENAVDMIVRSHQDFSEGYKLMHSGHLITIFSARNYFHNRNHGALLLITPDVYGDLRVRPKVIRAAKHFC